MKSLEFIIEHYKNIFVFPVWLILFFVSQIYKLIVINKRKKGYKEKISGVDIISVGNITTGGTGKTEFVLYLAERLKRKYAIVLRGYKSKSKSKKRFIEVKNNSSVKEVGDEALLLKQKISAPVFVSPVRKYGVVAAKQKYKISTVVLDDAFQHFKLQRSKNIVLIDYTNPFGNECLIPAGLLREPLSTLKYADLIVVTKYDKEYPAKYTKERLEKKIRKYNNNVQIIYSSYEPDFNLKKYKNKHILIFSAIANNKYFSFLVGKYLSPKSVKKIFFLDHHSYSKKDILKIFSVAEKNNIDYIFTTEKDIVKLNDIKNINVFKIKFKIPERYNFL